MSKLRAHDGLVGSDESDLRSQLFAPPRKNVLPTTRSSSFAPTHSPSENRMHPPASLDSKVGAISVKSATSTAAPMPATDAHAATFSPPHGEVSSACASNEKILEELNRRKTHNVSLTSENCMCDCNDFLCMRC
jgi:hypothetical protein